MKKRIMTRVIAGIMVVAIMLAQSSSLAKATGDSRASEPTVWSVPTTVKVLQHESVSDYPEMKKDAVVLVSGKNEYESGQIIISASGFQALKFTVSLSDLVDETDSDNRIKKEYFSVYTQKYIEAGGKYYPDAILPQENAVTYGQNTVKAGESGGAWLEFFIPADTKAGTYIGNATVTIETSTGTTEKSLPIKLKVYDVTIPEETSQKSLFTINYQQLVAHEGDGSQTMLDKYEEMLLRYRLSPSVLQFVSSYDADEFADRAYAWCLKGMSTIGLPMGSKTMGLDGFTVFDSAHMAECIVALAKKSLATNYNLIEKCAFYNFMIDEPFCVAYEDGKVAAYIKAFDCVIEQATVALQQDPSFTGTFAEQLLKDVFKIPDIVTDYNTDEWGNAHRIEDPIKNADGTDFTYEGKNVSVCPKPDAYNSEEERATYQTDRERWWYNCNLPKAPYPTYHVDDSMTSTIALEWMMAEYGIVGNLYWVVNRHALDNETNLEDPYASANRETGGYGDGALIYPGKQYGVDGSVASIRLDAIRDGYEDYELLQMLKSQCAFRGEDAEAVIREIAGRLYTDATVTGGASQYEEARELLLGKLEDQNAIVFLGGSIRVPELFKESSTQEEQALQKANLRFGYEITLPEGKTMEDVEWWWEWKIDGETSKTRKVMGEKYVALGDNTYLTNLVVTNIPADTDYGTNVCAVLRVSYKGEANVIADAPRIRSVKNVADAIWLDIQNGTSSETDETLKEYVCRLVEWKSNPGATDDNESVW